MIPRDLLDTPAEARFDRIARLAREQSGAAASLVALADDRRAWFKASEGIDVPEVPLDAFIGRPALQAGAPVAVADTLEDARFVGHPWVNAGPRFRAAIFQPLRLDGDVVGALGVLGPAPGALDGAGLEMLSALAERELRDRPWSDAQAELIGRLSPDQRRPWIDPVTRLWNRTAMKFLLWRELRDVRRRLGSVGALMVHLETHPSHGPAADALLAEAASCVRAAARPQDTFGLWEPGTLLGLLPGLAVPGSARVAERIRARIEARLPAFPVRIGVTSADGRDADRTALLWNATLALLRAGQGQAIGAVPPGIGGPVRRLEAVMLGRVC